MPLTVPPPATHLRPVSLAEFEPYLQRTGPLHARFVALRQKAAEESSSRALAGEETPARPAQGEGLLEAMKTVPGPFFSEQFSLSR